MSDTRTVTLPLLPLTQGVVLPQMVVPLALETPEAQAAADAAAASDGRLVLVPRHEDGDRGYATVGTVAHLQEAGRLPNGTRAVLVRGLARARIGAGMPQPTGEALWVSVDTIEESAPGTERSRELVREYRAVVEAILEHRKAIGMADALRCITDPGTMADTAGYSPDLSFEQKVEVLETIDVEERLAKVVAWARDTLGEIELKQRIRTDVSEGMERRQREMLLRAQMDSIRKELGEGADDAGGDYRARLEELPLPAEVKDTIGREIDRLDRVGEQSPEHSWIRTWLDRVFEMPWGTKSEDNLDLAAARAVLDADHEGLEDIKERIVEHLGVRKLRTQRNLDEPSGARGSSGAILVLAGPPGVGKTSLGESVARATGRKFVRVALGGVRDEAEVRGHRRTYVGAQPGRIVKALKEAGTMNPVILLDEVDKLGADWRGDPTSALLEVLDPAQNHTFRDHYLELDLDLSDVFFLATANVIEQIPAPLLDRMEILRLDGYTEDEKVAIASGHLIPRQQARMALLDGEVTITAAAVRSVVAGYTREAGVRSLERELGRILRKAAARIAAADGQTAPVVVDEADVSGYLGRRKFYDEAAERTSVPGVATGLAVTGAGGDVLFVEASTMPGEFGLAVTGQLGDVMKESSEIALSYVRAHAADLGLPADAFSQRFHVHFPAGAVPKDGPSAGVTMTTALVSLLTGRLVKQTVGMTGEVTLSGRVLPIGGVKQKVLAAHRAGLREVILPARNEADLEDVPEAVRNEMTFHLASEIGQVLAAALEAAA